MLKWCLYLIPSIIFTIICYLTNWLVVLFADKDGELHGILRYWQTWDNSLNPSECITMLPGFLTSWYDGHYQEHFAYIGELADLGRGRWYTVCYNDDFTIWQRITRYISRVYWLMRNSAGGFSFYILGADYNPLHEWYRYDNGEVQKMTDLDDPEVWSYCNSSKIFWRVYWNVYLGWKLPASANVLTRSMIANRICFKIN